jgi:hypothetical protein
MTAGRTPWAGAPPGGGGIVGMGELVGCGLVENGVRAMFGASF